MGSPSLATLAFDMDLTREPADIVANAVGQEAVGIELVEVRALEVSAAARADVGGA